jgi:hypothetical protein
MTLYALWSNQTACGRLPAPSDPGNALAWWRPETFLAVCMHEMVEPAEPLLLAE